MKHDVEPVLKSAEAELADLIRGQQQLTELHNKYVADYDAAETAWKSQRSAAHLDKMQQAKAYRDTVAESLREQAHEVTKAQSHVAQLREQFRRQGILADIVEDAVCLSALQAQHSEGVLELQATVRSEVLRLLALRDDWRQAHVLAWEKVNLLGQGRAASLALLKREGVDVTALALAAPTVGACLAPHQESYSFPMHPDADVQKTVGQLVQLIMQPEVERSEARSRAYTFSRRSVFPYQASDADDLPHSLVKRERQSVREDEMESCGTRPTVSAGQTITVDGGGEW